MSSLECTLQRSRTCTLPLGVVLHCEVGVVIEIEVLLVVHRQGHEDIKVKKSLDSEDDLQIDGTLLLAPAINDQNMGFLIELTRECIVRTLLNEDHIYLGTH